MPDDLPGVISEKLHKIYLANAGRNLFLTGTLIKILNLFDKNNIPALPFKGPALAELVYGDIALRQFSDLDILVSLDDASKARNLLETKGYQAEINLDDRQFRRYTKVEDDMAFFSGYGNALVELHWDLSGGYSSFPIHIETFQNRLHFYKIAGKMFPGLCREDLLVYLCVHGSKHCWERLEWIFSIAALVSSSSQLDWQRVFNLSKKLRCRQMLLLGLYMSNDFFHVPLPSSINKRVLKNTCLPHLAKEVYDSLFKERSTPVEPAVSSRFGTFHLKVRDNFPDKIRFFLRLALMPTKGDWREFPVPAVLSFLHYGLRPLRMGESLIRRLKAKGVH